ncbi:unnamed protein product [Auanema sp. JU1783]|nr:unnamed protein product [Auanema sp. JU1783]
MSASGKSAFVVGGTGAVGRKLVEALVATPEYTKIILLGRRVAEEVPESNKIEQHVVDFEKMEEHQSKIDNVDVGFCALGTTRSKSGADGFYKVDHDYIMNSANLAKSAGVKDFVLVSSGGADANSSFLYMKTKGQVEDETKALNFRKLLITRPGLLLGERKESRFFESLAKIVLTPMQYISDRFAISTENVAKAMVAGSLDESLNGTIIWDNRDLLKKAKEYKPQE